MSPFTSHCRAEHKKHCPKCAFLKIKDPHCVTVGDVLDLERKALENFIVSLCMLLLYPTNLVICNDVTPVGNVYSLPENAEERVGEGYRCCHSRNEGRAGEGSHCRGVHTCTSVIIAYCLALLKH